MFEYYLIVWRLTYEENINILTERVVAKLINNCCQWFFLLFVKTPADITTFLSQTKALSEERWSLPPVGGQPDCSDPFEVHLQFPDFCPFKTLTIKETAAHPQALVS